MKDITMKDIAKMCGVSIKTVSRVINGSNEVKAETKKKIEKVMQEHGYEANLLARGLKNKKTNTIIVFVDNHKEKYWGMWHTKLLSQLFREAKKEGFKIVVSPSSATGHLDDETDGFHLLTSKMVDGAILLDNANHDVRLEFLHKRNIPYVLVGQVENEEVTWVDLDNRGVGKVGCEYLVNKGYKKICLLLGQKQFHVNELRAQGFEEVAKQSNIEYRIFYEIDSIGVVHNILKQIREDFEYDALYISGSERAVGAYRILNEMKLKIPEDVAILGIDNLDICNYLYPAMSVVDQHCDIFAKNIINKLGRLIRSEERSGEKHFYIENTIIERETT